ncbi:hypothetical protein CIC12_11940 [Burkholderia sp. SG-MS1]|uniref:hypothetical protein n=1 Tax=Paraburkholderia sp. SG-MS1 TaxID=2023741 RepID=UPI001447E345|nr:hypothetical protein [Paraburkholderia sp. SG-MS1]NKJ47440.1 hypothetical protein [Paraburkholderia sp. SG-MS1]
MRLLATQEGLPRVSWGAVIAGVILSLVVYLVMSVLGTAIGTSLLAPMSRPDPLRGFGFGSGAWMIITTVVAVFVGSYFSGRCAPVLGWLHGLLSWAVMILLVVYGMTAFISGAVSAAGSVAATGAQVGAATANGANEQTRSATGNLLGSAQQQVQGALASAAAEASSPQAGQDERQAAEAASKFVARASWFSFAALVVGAIISIVSGGAGFRHQPPLEETGGSASGVGTRTTQTVRTGRPIG